MWCRPKYPIKKLNILVIWWSKLFLNLPFLSSKFVLFVVSLSMIKVLMLICCPLDNKLTKGNLTKKIYLVSCWCRYHFYFQIPQKLSHFGYLLSNWFCGQMYQFVAYCEKIRGQFLLVYELTCSLRVNLFVLFRLKHL